MTEAQQVLHLCREYNCTPSQAISELRHNPWIWDVMVAGCYEAAYREIERWDALPTKQKTGNPGPEGYWVDMVHKTSGKLAAAERDRRIKMKAK